MIKIVLLSAIIIAIILVTLLIKTINNEDFIQIQKELKKIKKGD